MANYKDLKNIQKAMFEMRSALLDNENIRKMLYFDSMDALSKTAPSKEEVLDYIKLFPITESGLQDFDKNTFINITCPDIDFTTDEETIYVAYFIIITTTKQLWELNDYKIRLLELGSEVCKELDNRKLSLPQTLQCLSMEDVVYDSSRGGYIIKLMSSDLQKDFEF